MATAFAIHARRIPDVKHRIALRAQRDTLMHRRKEAAAPSRIRQRLSDTRHHHHEGRQVFVLAAQAIAEPRTHARPTRQLGTGVHEQSCRIMIEGLGVKALHKANIIGNRTQMRQEFTHPSSGFAVSGKLIRRGQ